MVNARAVYAKLQTARTHPEEIPAVAGSGVYALFAQEADCLLPEIVLEEDGLLYMGMSCDLRDRDHFLAQHSGFSSPRRSLGAILSARLRTDGDTARIGSVEVQCRELPFRGGRGAAVERVDADEPRVRGVSVQRRGTQARIGDYQDMSAAAKPDGMAKPPEKSHSPFAGPVQGRGDEVARGNWIGHVGCMLPCCLSRTRSAALVTRKDIAVTRRRKGFANAALV